MAAKSRGRAILDRYATSADGAVIIDVATHHVGDLYNTFDRFSPDVRKDLDGELVAYVVGCAREIGRRPLCLRITLPERPDDASRAAIRDSFRRYVKYLEDTEKQEMSRTLRSSGVLLAAGLVLLLLAIVVGENAGQGAAILPRVFAEGLTVAAWVALWQVLAIYLVHWAPYRRALRLYRSLAAAPVDFAAPHDSMTPPAT